MDFFAAKYALTRGIKMFIEYLVTNDGCGVYVPATYDLTCGPSECFWLIPGTEHLLED